jgi:Mg-chelatase subunit ChlD
MSGRTWSGLLQALRAFLEIRRDSGGASDLVSVIQFSTTARMVFSGVPLLDAVAAVPSLRCGGGGTSFTPALRVAQQALLSQPQMSSVLVFMTDGQCSDAQPAIQESQMIATSLTGRLQFFGIAFNTAGETLRGMTDAASGTMVSADNVNDLRDRFQNIARQVSANYV